MLSQQQKNHPEYCPDFQPAYKQTAHANLTVPPQRGHSDSSPGHLMILALQSHRVFSPAHMNPTQPHLSSSAFPITEDLDPLVSTHPYPGVYAPPMSTHRDSIWTAPTNPSGQQKLPIKGLDCQKARPPWGSPTEPSLLFWAVRFFCNMLPAPPPCAMFGLLRTRYVQFICSYGNMQGRRVRRRRSNRPQLPTRWMKDLG